MSKHSSRGFEWELLKRGAKARARMRCEKCGAAGRLEVHHKKPKCEGGEDTMENVIVLCRGCHFREHPKEGTPGRDEWRKLTRNYMR